jgi:hypothetical protein
MRENVLPHIEAGPTLYTDEFGVQWTTAGFTHQIVNHAEQYVRDNVHTNTLENFWSLLNAPLVALCFGRAVSFVPVRRRTGFRFNFRTMTDEERLTEAMQTDRRTPIDLRRTEGQDRTSAWLGRFQIKETSTRSVEGCTLKLQSAGANQHATPYKV